MSVVDDYPPLPDELKSAYSFACVACGHEQMAMPSIFMHGFGMNVGGGNCLGCNTSLHLWIDGDVMKSKTREEYVREVEADKS